MEERMKILKLLEDGKITAEEAVKLLEAIKEGEPLYKVIFKEAGEAITSTMNSVAETLKNVSSTIADKLKKECEKVAEKVKHKENK